MYYDNSQGEKRLGLSSLILLTIFVSAFVLIVVAALWRPWAEDDKGPAEVVPGISVEEALPEGAAAPEVDAASAAP